MRFRDVHLLHRQFRMSSFGGSVLRYAGMSGTPPPASPLLLSQRAPSSGRDATDGNGDLDMRGSGDTDGEQGGDCEVARKVIRLLQSTPCGRDKVAIAPGRRNPITVFHDEFFDAVKDHFGPCAHREEVLHAFAFSPADGRNGVSFVHRSLKAFVWNKLGLPIPTGLLPVFMTSSDLLVSMRFLREIKVIQLGPINDFHVEFLIRVKNVMTLFSSNVRPIYPEQIMSLCWAMVIRHCLWYIDVVGPYQENLSPRGVCFKTAKQCQRIVRNANDIAVAIHVKNEIEMIFDLEMTPA